MQKAEIIIAVEEKLASLGAVIRQQHEATKKINLEFRVDPLLQQVMDDLVEFGVISIKRYRKNPKHSDTRRIVVIILNFET